VDTVVKTVWQTRISAHLHDSAALKSQVEDRCAESILAAAREITRSLGAGGKLMLCGNGGSAADAQHLAGEFVNRLAKQFQRPPMAALALTTDTSCLTAVGNDLGFDCVFERQVLALGRPGDTLLAISTSGQSENLVRAIQAAAETRIGTIGLLGQNGGRVSPLVDIAITVPSDDVQLIQEAHLTIEHILCDLVERMVHAGEERDQR
jgi:D-sedoheptulose 7-phosphate isomerase